MSKITGNEQVYPLTWDKSYNAPTETLEGITLRQLALKDFMCAMIAAGVREMNNVDLSEMPQAIAKAANDLTNAYIEQLNK